LCWITTFRDTKTGRPEDRTLPLSLFLSLSHHFSESLPCRTVCLHPPSLAPSLCPYLSTPLLLLHPIHPLIQLFMTRSLFKSAIQHALENWCSCWQLGTAHQRKSELALPPPDMPVAECSGQARAVVSSRSVCVDSLHSKGTGGNTRAANACGNLKARISGSERAGFWVEVRRILPGLKCSGSGLLWNRSLPS
jgi:hypothetical protein